MNTKKKLAFNTATSLLLQVVTVLCGLILPRLILQAYGTQVNGLVQSITQFLGVISLLELGIGQVIQSALYKPLAQKDTDEISRILASGDRFFRRIAYILAVYVAVLILVYPFLADGDFGWGYTAALIGAISISSFAQYYFGIIDRLLLNADQRGYIQYTSQILTLVLNTVACVMLIRFGFSIQMVKLVSSLIFLARPFAVRLYVNKHYTIHRRIPYDGEPIRQKWNGIAQHVSAFILNGTDTIVLTLFSTLSDVSVYSVYHLVVYGIHQLYQSATAGLHAVVGDLWAKQKLDTLRTVYGYIETALHFSTVFLFSCTGVLIVPFVQVYTDGLADQATYINPLFAVLIVGAHAMQCLKTTYNMMILGGGHYKQTQRCHIMSAAINVVVSVATVHIWGLIGVAIGTLAAMAYQTVWMAWYDSRQLLCWPFRYFFKQLVLDIVTAGLIYASTSWISLTGNTYGAFFLMAIEVAAMAFVITAVMAFLFQRQRVLAILRHIFKR